jgi:hypothetical protein
MRRPFPFQQSGRPKAQALPARGSKPTLVGAAGGFLLAAGLPQGGKCPLGGQQAGVASAAWGRP